MHRIQWHSTKCQATWPHPPEREEVSQHRAECIARWLADTDTRANVAYLNWSDPTRRATVDRKGRVEFQRAEAKNPRR
jgi:hypothetical protein